MWTKCKNAQGKTWTNGPLFLFTIFWAGRGGKSALGTRLPCVPLCPLCLLCPLCSLCPLCPLSRVSRVPCIPCVPCVPCVPCLVCPVSACPLCPFCHFKKMKCSVALPLFHVARKLRWFSLLSYDNMRVFFRTLRRSKGCDFSWKKCSQNSAWLVKKIICLMFNN